MAPLLAVDRLTLGVGRRTLVEDASFAVFPGELWCVLGPNGAGKTQLLHALAGLRAVDSGSIRIAGRTMAEWSLRDAARLRAFLPQTIHDAFGATALEIVMMGRHPHLGRWSWESAADRAIAEAALTAMDLGGAAQRDVTTLSGGERQRVAIAALLAQRAPLMLLDEPATHLDLRHQIGVLARFAALAREGDKAVMLSIHDFNLARRFATHALLFRGGARVAYGEIAEIMTAEALAAAFDHPLAQVSIAGRSVFVPE